MTEKTKILLPLLLSVMMSAGIILGGKMQDAGPIVEIIRYKDNLGNAAMEGPIEEMIRYIDARYVDPLSRDSLIKQAISTIVGQLDPHSDWLPPLEVQRLKESREGHFSGIGLEFTLLNDTVFVLRNLEDSPSSEAGILAGDRLLMINDSLIAGPGITYEKVATLIRGEQGSKVRLKLWRPGEGNLDVQVRRASISTPSVMPGIMLDSTTGYLAIKRFGATTYREFMQELEILSRDQGMKDLLIDLRGNPGGYLNEATNILSQLFEDRKNLLVYTVGRTNDRREYTSTGKVFFRVGKVILLVDEGSASASEIMAGAIQDWDRGLIAGRRTFGKGLVQEQYPLKDGSALLLTVSRYFTPSGRSIQRDYSDAQAYAKDLTSRSESGELTAAKPVFTQDTTVFFTYGGREVFGGGGIVPDIHIPLDSVRVSTVYRQLLEVLPRFIIEEILQGNPRYTFEDITDHSKVLDQEVWAKYVQFVKKNNTKLAAQLESKSMAKAIRYRLFNEVGRILGGENAQNAITAGYDPEVQLTLGLFKQKKLFDDLD
jgi:carboxyl-terminal processing protease